MECCREVEDLAKYLAMMGDRESQAKQELQDFIDGLLQRAQSAEDQVQSLQADLLLNTLPTHTVSNSHHRQTTGQCTSYSLLIQCILLCSISIVMSY